MDTKTCNACETTKPITDFQKRGMWKGEVKYRGKCKECANTLTRDSHRKQEGAVRPAQYIEMSEDRRQTSYHTTINRMVRLGIMTEKSAKEARERLSGN